MPDQEQNEAVMYLVILAHQYIKNNGADISVHAGPGVNIPSQRAVSSSLSTSPVYATFYPDVTVGDPDRSQGTQGYSYPVGRPPKVVFEITSANRDTDFNPNKKARLYALAGVELYVIIDRYKENERKINRNPCVCVGKLKNGEYDFTKYHGTDIVNVKYIGTASS